MKYIILAFLLAACGSDADYRSNKKQPTKPGVTHIPNVEGQTAPTSTVSTPVTHKKPTINNTIIPD